MPERCNFCQWRREGGPREILCVFRRHESRGVRSHLRAEEIGYADLQAPRFRVDHSKPCVMRSSRSQLQPFARHWPTGRPSGTVVLVAVSVAAALAQLSFWLFDRADPLAAVKLF